MDSRLERSTLLLGEDTLNQLRQKRVAVFGLGGVGGYALEMLARLGIGSLDLIDPDVFSLSNLNRQILATKETLGKKKTEVAKARVLSIAPDCNITTYPLFYLPEVKDQIPFASFDYIIDCIDTITAKLDIIETAYRLNIPIISAMGCGNRLDPTKLKVCDLYETSNDPLCKVMRRELKKRNVPSLKVVYSTEDVLPPLKKIESPRRKDTPGSVCFVPSAAGILLAYEAFKDLTQFDRKKRK